MKVSFLLALLHVSSVLGISKYGCADANTFHKENIKSFKINIQQTEAKDSLYNFLRKDKMKIDKWNLKQINFENGEEVNYNVKIVTPDEDPTNVDAEREAIILKYLCGLDTYQIVGKIVICGEKAFTLIMGCAENEEELLFIQEFTYYNLSDEKALDKFRSSETIIQILVILNVLDKVNELHHLGIIHSDISPVNFGSKDIELYEIELFNFGMAGVNQSGFYGGDYLFLPPEFLQKDSSSKLSPKLDIYSLGITIMYLIKGFSERYKEINSDCFMKEFTLTCHAQIIEAVREVLKKEHPLHLLLPIIEQALAYDPKDRQDSVEEILRAIVDFLPRLDDYKSFITSSFYSKLVMRMLEFKRNDIFTWITYGKFHEIFASDFKKNDQQSSNLRFRDSNQASISTQVDKQKQQLNIVNKQILTVSINKLEAYRKEKEEILQMLHSNEKDKLDKIHRNHRSKLFYEHKTSELTTEQRKLVEIDLENIIKKQSEELRKNQQAEMESLQELIRIKVQQLKEELDNSNIMVDKQVNPILKSCLTKHIIDKHSRNNYLSDKQSSKIRSVNFFNTDCYSEWESENLKHQSLDNYNKISKGSGKSQKIQQTNTSDEKPNIPI